MVSADSNGISRAPSYSGSCMVACCFRLRGYYPVSPSFPAPSASRPRPDSSPNNPLETEVSKVWALPRSLAATRGIDSFFLLLRVLRCFSSPRSPPRDMYSPVGSLPKQWGFPIRTSPGDSLLAALRSLSQLATSFIASWRQGIHREPLSSLTSTSR